MTSDGKRAVQPKRNEWGYPDTYDGDTYDDSNPPGGVPDPDDQLMTGKAPVVAKVPDSGTVQDIGKKLNDVIQALSDRGVTKLG